MGATDIGVTNGQFLIARKGFDRYEFDAIHNWMWAIEHEAEIGIRNITEEKISISLGVSLNHLPSYEGRKISVEMEGIEVQSVITSCRYNISTDLEPGEEKAIVFRCDAPFMKVDGDDRQLAFQFCDIVCEIKSVYEPSKLIKSIQKCELEIFKTFDEICSRHNIKYMMFYGSLLGAVRHKGIIPWDDDIDIAMDREAYETFVKYAKEELPQYYFLQTLFSDENAFYGGYAKLRDSRTTAIDKLNRKSDSNEGVWIDIFPIDKVFSDVEKRKLQLKHVTHWQHCLLVKIYGLVKAESFDVDDIEYRAIVDDSHNTAEFIRDRLHEAFMEAKDESVYLCSILAQNKTMKNRRFYTKDIFEETIKVCFEDILVDIPKNISLLLTQHAGRDYMVYPMVKEHKHDNMFWDLSRPYTDYKDSDLLEIKKEVILEGVNEISEHYWQQHHAYENIPYVVDDDTTLVGSLWHDAIVVSKEMLEHLYHI